jgi:hypothetical protein
VDLALLARFAKQQRCGGESRETITPRESPIPRVAASHRRRGAALDMDAEAEQKAEQGAVGAAEAAHLGQHATGELALLLEIEAVVAARLVL